MRCYILIGLIILFSIFAESKTTFDLTNSCNLVFQEFKIKTNYTISVNGSLDYQKYGCKTCTNTTTNETYSCEPCYLEINGTYPVLPLVEYVRVTQTDLDYNIDRVLLNNKLESFKVSQQNFTPFDNKTTLNDTIINFKKDDKLCIYSNQKFVSCSSINGSVCNSTQECPGIFLKSDDADRCCNKNCRDLVQETPEIETPNFSNQETTNETTSQATETQLQETQTEILEDFPEELNVYTGKKSFFSSNFLLILIFIIVLILILAIVYFIFLRKKEKPSEPEKLW